MAGIVEKNPGRLGIFLLLFSLLAAMLAVFFISFASDSEQLTGQGETIASQAAVPDVESSPAANVTATGQLPASADAPDPATGNSNTVTPVFAEQVTGNTGGGANPSQPIPTPAPGMISGLVLSEESLPLVGVNVSLFLPDGTPAGISATTVPGGSFSIQVDPGQYKLFFSDPAGVYQSDWYGGYGPGSAALVSVDSGQKVAIAQIMHQVVSGSFLTGTVRDEDGAGVAGVNVLAFLFLNVGCANDVCDTIELKGLAVTDGDGVYGIGGLDPGDYKVMFSPQDTALSVQWYREQSTYATAKAVRVEEGKTTADIDARLYLGGTISGTVSKQGGRPAAYTLVDVYDATGIIAYSGITDGNGNYRTSHLPDGDYRVHAATNMPTGWTEEWYSDKHDYASADPVTVSRGVDTSGVDIEIGDPAQIPEEPDDGVIIIIFDQPGMIAGLGPTPASADSDARQVDAGAQAGEGSCSGPGTVGERSDDMVLADEDQQDVIGDGSDQQAAASMLESEGARPV